MTINISLPEVGPNLHPVITVIGVGGAGGNAVNNMIRSNLEGVDFLITNTDAQALENSTCDRKIQLGIKSTKGLGAGMRPDVGRKAAEETLEEIDKPIDTKKFDEEELKVKIDNILKKINIPFGLRNNLF